MKLPTSSSLLAFLPLAGIAYIAVSGDLFTVDGLFMVLILLSISGVFAVDVALDLHSAGMLPFIPGGGPQGLAMTVPGQPGAKMETGAIKDLRFFEAHVGEPNKTLVEFVPDGAKTSRFLSFIGNVRDQLTVGARVRMIYRSDPDGNVLLDRENLLLGR